MGLILGTSAIVAWERAIGAGRALIPQNDIQVAATARSLDFEVLVGPNDEAHFRRIEGLGVRVFGS